MSMGGRTFVIGLCVVAFFSTFTLGSSKTAPNNRVGNLELSTVTRNVDLTTPLVKQKIVMVVENKGPKAVTSMLYAVEPQLADKVTYIGAQVSINWKLFPLLRTILRFKWTRITAWTYQ